MKALLKRLLWQTVGVVLVALMVVGIGGHFQTTTHAQASNQCDETISVSVSAAASQTIASAIPGATVYVCAYDLSADTLATTGQLASGSTNLTGAMRFCDECGHQASNGGGVILQTPPGGALTLAAVTGAITGWIRIGQN